MKRIQLISLFLAATCVFVSGCASNPATGGKNVVLGSMDGEKKTVQKNHQEIVKAMGLYDDQATQEYVNKVGTRLALSSDLPNEEFKFFVIDHEELEFLGGQIAHECDALADHVHVFLRGLIVIQAQRLDDFLVVLLNRLLLALQAADADTLAPGRRVAHASQRQQAGRRYDEQGMNRALHYWVSADGAERVFNYDTALARQVPAHL